MTRDETIKETITAHDRMLKRLWCIAYVEGQKDEREACAKVCDEEAASWARLNAQDEEGYSAIQCAAAIRARGESRGSDE